MLDGGSGYCTLYSFINTFLHRYELWGKKSDLMLNMFDLTSSDLFSNNCSDKEELAFLSIYKIQSSHLDNSLIHSTQLVIYLFFFAFHQFTAQTHLSKNTAPKRNESIPS